MAQRLRFTLSTALGVLLMAGCGDSVTAPAPVEEAEEPTLPEWLGQPLSYDAVASSLAPENFFFLPPLGPRPSSHGTLDARRMPEVEICRVSGGACVGDAVERYTTSEGPLYETVRVFTRDTQEGVRGFYAVVWATRHSSVSDGLYRVRVSLDGQELGTSDVALTRSIWQYLGLLLKWSRDPMAWPVPALNGLPFPIAFRINQGATPTPPPSAWDHEPEGLTVLTDQPWDALTLPGWGHGDRASTSRIAQDATAPLSAPNVLEQVYPADFPGGDDPAVDYFYNFGVPSVDDLFAGFWFRTGETWNSGQAALAYVFLQGGGMMQMNLDALEGGGYTVRPYVGGTRVEPSAGAPVVTAGTWHRVEMRFTITGGGQGALTWWVDGVQAGSASGLSLPGGASGVMEFQHAVTAGASNTSIYFDHTYLSGN